MYNMLYIGILMLYLIKIITSINHFIMVLIISYILLIIHIIVHTKKYNEINE